MTLNFQRIYRNLSCILISIGIVVFFILFARAHSGYEIDIQKLSLSWDLIFSVGIFLVGIPLLVSLILPDVSLPTSRKYGFQVLSFTLRIFAFLASITFLFLFENKGYIGFVQMPSNGFTHFLIAIMFSILGAALDLFERVISKRSFNNLNEVVSVFFNSSALGVAMTLVILQVMSVWFGLPDFYQATLPIFEFLRQLVIVSTFSTLATKYIRNVNQLNNLKFAIWHVISSFFILIGFQSFSLELSSSGYLYFINFISMSIGLSGFIGLFLKLIFQDWAIRRTHILETGLWIPQSLTMISLFLSVFSLIGMGYMSSSVGIYQNIFIALSLFAVPLMLVRITDQGPVALSVLRYMAIALSWVGLILTLAPLILLAPYGGSFSNINFEAFHPLFTIVLVGIFIMGMSFFVSFWDKVLTEFI